MDVPLQPLSVEPQNGTSAGGSGFVNSTIVLFWICLSSGLRNSENCFSVATRDPFGQRILEMVFEGWNESKVLGGRSHRDIIRVVRRQFACAV
jgi:hypothetical protein